MRLAPFSSSAVLALSGVHLLESSEQNVMILKNHQDSYPSIHPRDPFKFNLGNVEKIGKEVATGLVGGGIDAFTEATSAPTTTACARSVRNGDKRGIGGLAGTVGKVIVEDGIPRIMGGTASVPEPQSC
ncbi:hypothetical protein K435DRAFT_776065 [Dendrothele bispora CBS 962.96]|uniref:Uncharacterized protein n=1 Tax=Dendrothele bispora (strain CBS 962.96) TaxID=1314807 RepID=A0A4S8MFB8_DENBC|nr:hypothetical protein K435DRAFT_776065 [Dendrothele bispora CBS 962.96]